MDKKTSRLSSSTVNHGRSPASLASATSSSSQTVPTNPNQSFHRYGLPKVKGVGNNGSIKNYKNRGSGRSSVQRKPDKPQEHSYEVKDEVEKSSVIADAEKRVKHGKTANHLLNFSYAPIQSHEGRAGGSVSTYERRSRKLRTPIITKEQFLQANCQFVVRCESDMEFVEHLSHADKMVPWECIEQIRLTDEQLATCPICLDVPVAAKMTKCSHIYCWPCILHYLSLSDHAWARCPICFDAVDGKDLKSVSVTVAPKIAVGEKVIFTLMKRERDSLYIRPRDNWRSTGSGKLHSVNATEEEDTVYSKILTATNDDIIAMLTEERRQLQVLINHHNTQSLEASFVQMALDELITKTDKLNPVTFVANGGSSLVTDPAQEECETLDAPTALRLKPSSELKTVSYLDAFSNETAEDCAADDSDSLEAPASNVHLSQQPPDTIQPEACADTVQLHVDIVQPEAPNEQLDFAKTSDDAAAATAKFRSSRVRSSSSTCSSNCADSDYVAADLTLPPTGTQNPVCTQARSKRTEVYYFYQAADGRNIYLHSINTRILAAEYGSLELAPATLTATILESEVNSMSADLRRRLKYLSHLPLCSQFTVCEVLLRPPVVSSSVLSHFTEELTRRKRTRNRRARTESRQLIKAQAEERRKIGLYPDMGMALHSNRHFPIAVVNDVIEPPVTSGSLVTSSDPAAGPHSSPLVTDLQTCNPPVSTPLPPVSAPLSFAQTMRGAAGNEAAWRRAYQPTNSAAAQKEAANVRLSDDSESASAPTFKDSFCADFDKLLSDGGSSIQGSGPVSAAKGKGGRKKGKKQQLVLFSTSGQRTNN